MTELGQIMDHAADMQRQLDRLWTELVLLWLAVLALSVVLALQAWQRWGS